MFSVYLVSAEINKKKCYKIGYTKRTVEERIREFKTGNASEFEIVDFFTSQWGTKIEALLHKTFKNKKVNGEWFNLDESDILLFRECCEKFHNNFEMMLEDNTYIIDRVEKGKQKIF